MIYQFVLNLSVIKSNFSSSNNALYAKAFSYFYTSSILVLLINASQVAEVYGSLLVNYRGHLS